MWQSVQKAVREALKSLAAEKGSSVEAKARGRFSIRLDGDAEPINEEVAGA